MHSTGGRRQHFTGKLMRTHSNLLQHRIPVMEDSWSSTQSHSEPSPSYSIKYIEVRKNLFIKRKKPNIPRLQHGFPQWPRGSPTRVSPFRQVQSHSQQLSSELEGRFLQQLSSVRSELDAQITGSSEQLLGALGQLQQETLRSAEGITTCLGLEGQK